MALSEWYLLDDGYAPVPGYFKFALEKICDLNSPAMPRWDFYGYDGFVVLYGTDTMAYTASALSFMLENLKKPVILTGSQIPLCELRSDAKDNNHFSDDCSRGCCKGGLSVLTKQAPPAHADQHARRNEQGAV